MSKKSLFHDFDGCEHCLVEWLDCYQQWLSSQPDGFSYVWNVLLDNGIEEEEWGGIIEDLKCPACQETLELGDALYVRKDLAITIASELAEFVSEGIGECEYCDSGPISYTQRYGDSLTLKTVYQLQDEYGVPDELWEVISERIRCTCGNELDLDSPYTTKYEVDRWFGEELEEYEVAQFMIETFGISTIEAQRFIKHLMRYPMLGMEHEVGKKILKTIRSSKMDGIMVLDQLQTFSRSRKRNLIQRHVPFIDSELWAPPEGIPVHGRYNPIGVPVLYLGDSIKTCLAETHVKSGEAAEVATFQLLKTIRVLDIRRDGNLSDLVSIPALTGNPLTKEYIFPNFLAQCCALSGIHGIVYESVQNSEGWNLALLQYEPERTVRITKIETYDHSFTQDAPSKKKEPTREVDHTLHF
ncbi:RES family NAD+ phosphorylase [Brevibacillus centrosporus]|jgi:RES domain-containing protein|uniref:RES family NAD+ phosphorylase n=1 Tax=Brevibacillus centrosporus TaxID=54910 RepID=UPI00398691B7